MELKLCSYWYYGYVQVVESSVWSLLGDVVIVLCFLVKMAMRSLKMFGHYARETGD
jgi:hypothetical protein